MRVTVTELPERRDAFDDAWDRLVSHVADADSDVVVLPEMPFYTWLPASRTVDGAAWQDAVDAHDRWEARLGDLDAAVFSSRPVVRDGTRLNEGFFWTPDAGSRGVHQKYYLPDEEGFWEASWYDRGDGLFSPVEYDGNRFGFLICTDMWAMESARDYGRRDVNFLVTPRATMADSLDKWVAGGRTSAVVSGAFSLSANRVGDDPNFAGGGWVIDPDGEVLGRTSGDRPFVTVEVDPEAATRAKETYPRYALY